MRGLVLRHYRSTRSETVNAERPPHLLYVAWGYPPARGGGVYRALATPNAFARDGWRVTVLTVERDVFTHTTGGDASLEARIDPSISVERIAFDVPAYRVRLSEWSRWRARYPELWNGWRQRRDRHIFPEPTYGPWRPEVEAAALRIHEADPVDLTIATANPNVDFAAAYALHAVAKVPYVMDYRDAWQLDVFSGARVTAPGSAVDTWESRMVEAAHEIWFVNEPIAQWHRNLYPAASTRMHVVANGFDGELTGFTASVREERTESLTFGYVGTMSDQVPLPALLEGWRLARERDPLIARSRLNLYGYLGHAGSPNNRWVRLIRDNERHGVEHLGPVAKAAIAETYATMDALVLLLGTGRYVTSGKVYEYCATGLPIVSVHDPNNAASDVLREHPAWEPARSLSAIDIADAVIEGGRRAVRQTERSRSDVQRWAKQFERTAQLAPRLARLKADVA